MHSSKPADQPRNENAANLRQRGIALLETGKQAQSAALDALVLLEHVSALSRSRLIALGRDIELSPEMAESFLELCSQRAEGLPLAYLLGVKEFFGLDILVGPGVLIPRPETEHLVEAACDWLKTREQNANASKQHSQVTTLVHCLDLCTGSACIPIALTSKFPNSLWLASDIDDAALTWAKKNIAHHSMQNCIKPIQSDLFSFLTTPRAQGEGIGKFDLITANPPYVSPEDASDIHSMGWGEPDRALFAGMDGLEVLFRIIEQAADYLLPGGCLLLEFGSNQAKALLDALRAEGYSSYNVLHDLAGHPRVVQAQARL